MVWILNLTSKSNYISHTLKICLKSVDAEHFKTALGYILWGTEGEKSPKPTRYLKTYTELKWIRLLECTINYINKNVKLKNK